METSAARRPAAAARSPISAASFIFSQALFREEIQSNACSAVPQSFAEVLVQLQHKRNQKREVNHWRCRHCATISIVKHAKEY